METCLSCLWSDQCGQLHECECGECDGLSRQGKCDYYSPVDDRGELTYYDAILAENVGEYRLVSAEYDDCRLEDLNG